MHDSFLAYATDPRHVLSTIATQKMWQCLLPPAASRQRGHTHTHKKKRFNYKQSVEIGHYGGGML